VHEALEEVALVRFGGAPDQLQLLVRGEVLAAADQVEAAEETTWRFGLEGARASPARPSNAGRWFASV
jgi:hypothetical protein